MRAVRPLPGTGTTFKQLIIVATLPKETRFRCLRFAGFKRNQRQADHGEGMAWGEGPWGPAGDSARVQRQFTHG